MPDNYMKRMHSTGAAEFRDRPHWSGPKI